MMANPHTLFLALQARDRKNNMSHSQQPAPAKSNVPSQTTHVAYGAANRFFHDPDMCTLFTHTLVGDLRSMLAFRWVTRQSWEAVTLEKTSRKTRMLDPETPGFQGIIKFAFALDLQDPPYLGQPFFSFDAADVAELVAETKVYRHPNYSAPKVCHGIHETITLHPAFRSQFRPGFDYAESILRLRPNYDIFKAPPSHLDMFLTQPPQTAILLHFAYYDYCDVIIGCSGKNNCKPMDIRVKEGIRLRHLVDRLKNVKSEGEMGVDFQQSSFGWSYLAAIEKESDVWKKARENTRKRERGETNFLRIYG